MTVLVKIKAYHASNPAVSISKRSKISPKYNKINREYSCKDHTELVSAPLMGNPVSKENIYVPCQTSMWKDYFCNRHRIIKHSRFLVPNRIQKIPMTEYTMKSNRKRSIIKHPEWICPKNHKWISFGLRCMTLYQFDFELDSRHFNHYFTKPSNVIQSVTNFFLQHMCMFNNFQSLNVTKIAHLQEVLFSLRHTTSGIIETSQLFSHQPELLKLLSIVLSHVTAEIVAMPIRKYDLQFIPKYACILLETQSRNPGFGDLFEVFQTECGMQPQFVTFGVFHSLFSTKRSHLYFCETNMVKNLEIPQCSSQFYQCSDGTCVPHYERCNSVSICPDGSDEVGCISFSGKNGISKCAAATFHCTSGECVHIDKVCDTFIDCIDKSDEYLCDNRFEHSLNIPTEHEQILQRYVPVRRNNLHLPAINRGQTNQMINFVKLSTGGDINFNFKGETLLRCSHSSHKMHISIICFMKELNNELLYCVDGSHLVECTGVNCQNNFKCKISGICIPLEYLCNGYRDCEAGEDEANCNNLSCPGMLKCGGSGVCIEHQEICNGVVSCYPYGDDELFCFDCPQNCACEGMYAECHSEIDNGGNLFLNIEQGNVKSVKMSVYSQNKENLSFNLYNLKSVLRVSLDNNNLSGIFYTDDAYNTKISMQNISQIKVLSLNHNLLRSLCCDIFKHMYFLIRLSSNENIITHVTDDVFSGAVHIKIIELSRNHICCVTKHAFRDNFHLKSLDLTNNPLVSLHWDTFQFLTSLEWLGEDSDYLCCALRHVKSCIEENNENQKCNLLMMPIFYNIWLLMFGVLCICVNTVAYVKIETTKTLEGICKTFLIIIDALFGVYLIVIGCTFYRFRNSFGDYFRKWQTGTLCLLCSYIFWAVTELTTLFTCAIAISRAVAALRPFSKKEHLKRYLFCIQVASPILLALSGYLFIDYFSNEFSNTGEIFHPDVFCNSYILLHIEKTFQIAIFIAVAFNVATLIGFNISYIIVYFMALKGYFRLSAKGKRKSRAIVHFILKGLRLLFHNGIFTSFKLVIYLGVLTKSQDIFTLVRWYTTLIYPCYSLLNTCVYYMGQVNYHRLKNK